ncbi:MAG TPA: hypothetical protein VM933_08565 [Acidimicrobiales bacterium]|nr:hypothetical protein [Acidimicrobiales bacterium]
MPADGLYVSYGADVDAIAAVVFTLAPGSTPTKLVLELSPTTTPLPALLACRVVPEASGFTPVQNGPWSQLPRYDCTNAPAAVVDPNRTTMTFAPPVPGADGVLAVALVPNGPGRAAFKKPGDRALEVTEAALSESGSRDEPAFSTIPASEGPGALETPPSTIASSVPDSRLPPSEFTTASPEPVSAAPPVEVDAPTTPMPAVTTGPARRVAEGIWGLRKRLGGVLGVGLLTAMLLYYSQGHGPLGARLDPVKLLSRQERK